jgi:hypothetical protein
MKNLRKIILTTFIIGLTFVSCKQNEVEGILIDQTLYVNQTLSKNKELRQLIKQTLNKDEKALAKLNDFWCGGGAGCYDLGFVITQIIYRQGEQEFMTMADKLNYKEIRGLESLIMAGLEYGDNDKDGKMDNKRIENEFPKLFELLKSKRQNE